MAAADAAADPLLGQMLGNCRLEAVLGRGAMGAVYRATQAGLERTVAVKVLWAELASNPKYVSRFERESRLIARLRHPNIVDVYSAGVHGEHRFLVMEFVEGRPLSQLIRERGGLPPDYATDLMLQACRGLEAAWSHGVMHRDIKPDNLLVTSKGIVKVADFGLAKNVDEGTDLTRVGQIMGTPLYMSPEQAEGRTADIRTDIYALGITFWQVLAGRPPYQAETALALLRAHVDKPLPDVRPHAPLVSDALWAVIERMCAKDRDHRYADPVALAAALADPAAAVAGTVMDLLERRPVGAQTVEDVDPGTIHDPGEPAAEVASTSAPVSGGGSTLRLAAGVLVLAGAIAGGLAWLNRPGAAPVPVPGPVVSPAPAPTPATTPAPAAAAVPGPVAAPVDPATLAYAAAMARARSAVDATDWPRAERAVGEALAAVPADAAALQLKERIESEVARRVRDARIAAAQLALATALAEYRAQMESHEYEAAMGTAVRASTAMPGDDAARAAVREAGDARRALRELSRGRQVLFAGDFDAAAESVSLARSLYPRVTGAEELLAAVAIARTGAAKLAEAATAASEQRWSDALAAVEAAAAGGADPLEVERLEALARRGIALESADAALPHAGAAATRRLLPSGVEVVVVPTKVRHGEVQVSVTVRGAGSGVTGGSLAGTGVAALTRRLLSPASTARRSRLEARGMLQALSASVTGHDGKDHLRISVAAPAEHLSFIVPLLAAWVRDPTIPVSEFHAVRRELSDASRARRRERWSIEWRQLTSAVWGGHPWSADPEGTPQGLEQLTRRAVADYHQAQFVPGALVVTVAGDCDPAEALRLVHASFGDGRGQRAEVPRVAPLTKLPVPDRIQRAVPGLAGATVYFAWRTPPSDHADRPALDAAAAVLGRIARFRLAEVVAAGAGRTGQARHWSGARLDGFLYAGVRCAPADVAGVERGMAAAVHSLVTEPPTASEVREAVALVRPSPPSGDGALEQLTAEALRTTLFGNAPAYWADLAAGMDAVTPSDVVRVARNRLADEARLTLVLIPVR